MVNVVCFKSQHYWFFYENLFFFVRRNLWKKKKKTNDHHVQRDNSKCDHSRNYVFVVKRPLTEYNNVTIQYRDLNCRIIRHWKNIIWWNPRFTIYFHIKLTNYSKLSGWYSSIPRRYCTHNNIFYLVWKYKLRKLNKRTTFLHTFI